MKGEYSDYLPLNARVTVDYRKKKVNFEYPNKDERFIHRYLGILSTILPTWFVLLWRMIIEPIGISLFIIVILDVVNYLDLNLIIKQTIQILEPYNYLIGTLFWIVLATPFIFSAIMTLNYPKFSNKFPAWSAKLHEKDMIKTRVTELKSKTYELPYFKNVVLNYEAKGEFSKYLDRIEIRELPFKILKKKKGKEELVNQDYLWKAKFFFSKIPKKGELNLSWY